MPSMAVMQTATLVAFVVGMYILGIRSLIIQHEFYEELLAKTTDERNIEADIHLTGEEAAGEKVYE